MPIVPVILVVTANATSITNVNANVHLQTIVRRELARIFFLLRNANITQNIIFVGTEKDAPNPAAFAIK